MKLKYVVLGTLRLQSKKKLLRQSETALYLSLISLLAFLSFEAAMNNQRCLN